MTKTERTKRYEATMAALRAARLSTAAARRTMVAVDSRIENKGGAL